MDNLCLLASRNATVYVYKEYTLHLNVSFECLRDYDKKCLESLMLLVGVTSPQTSASDPAPLSFLGS